MKAKGDVPGEIVDALEAGPPEGLTKDEIATTTGHHLATISKGIRAARLILSDGDTMFILAEPQGFRKPWRYRLVDGSVIPNAEETAWTANRVLDAQSRVTLLSAAMEVATAATSSRTTIGKKARVLDKQLRRLKEDLEEIDV